MHILIVNDDGPPSNASSPYVHSLVQNLQSAGHTVSVCLPHTQRSWIGKAHIIGQTVKPTYFRPGTLHQDDGTTHSRPSGAKDQEEWVLVDGTPASCVQIGLYHFFQDKGPVDLVVSGPNYGRNSTAVFSLSSGTLGGALEAAVCKRKAVALSYAFFSRNHDPEIIAGASKLSVRLIEYLYANWGKEVDLYTVNVPLVENVDTRKVMWTNMLQNYWENSSCFQEVVDEEGDAEEEEQKIRDGEGSGEDESQEQGMEGGGHKHKHFKWAPRFTDVYKSVEEAPPGNDGWAVKEGFTSVTPLKANFMHAAAETTGELKLPQSSQAALPDFSSLSLSEPKPANHFYALIDYEDAYVQPLILAALASRLPSNAYTLIHSISDLPSPSTPFLQVSSYETLPFEHALSHPTTSLTNAYIIRKALIRKHYLSTTAYNWIAKHPSSILATNVKPACEFEVDYAEFLDDALVEAWELRESWGRGESKEQTEREWWILKPGMSDRGQGIRLFSSEEELQAIFDGWEEERGDSDEEDETETDDAEGAKKEGEKEGDYIVTSHLRHFIAQPYIHPPLLLPGNPRKFHIRTYVLAVGSLKVYVYKEMLALFAPTPYVAPWDSTSTSDDTIDLSAHLTNTCLQSSSFTPVHAGSVLSFSHISSSQLPQAQKDLIFTQICATTGEVFEAAAKGMMVHFQTLPNAFEVFGLDFLVDEGARAWLLEVNAFPDFRQTGDELRGLVGGLWEGVVDVAVGEFFKVDEGKGNEKGGKDGGEGAMVLVREVDLGRR